MTAIFLLVILTALGAFMLSMSTVQHTTSAQDIQGSRGYQAARSGIEWGVYQVMAPENANYNRTSAFTTQYNCPAVATTIGTLNTLQGALAGFTVTVSCARATYDEGGNRISVYQLQSTAKLGVAGTTNYIERQVSATVSTCRKTDNGENC